MAEKNVEKLRKKSKAASDRWQGQGQGQDTDRLGGSRGGGQLNGLRVGWKISRTF